MIRYGTGLRIGSLRWPILLLALLLAAPGPARADDSELFITRANPNVLLMLDTTGSMDTVDSGVTGVGDLDGEGTANTRMDILWKVVYTLLNANVSIPSSTTTVTTTLRSSFSAGYQSSIRVSGTNWSQFPNSGTVQVGNGSNVDTVTYSSKYYNWWRGQYYLQFSPNAYFAHSHSAYELVSYSAGSGYSYPYPVNHTQAMSTDFQNNINSDDEAQLKVRMGLMTFTTNSTGSSVQINVRNQIGSTSPNAPPFQSPTRYSDIWNSVKSYAYASGGTPTAQALNRSLNFFTACYDPNVRCRKNFAILITDGEDTMGGIDGATGNGRSPNYYQYGTFYSDGYSGNTGQVARNNAVIQEAAALKAQGIELFTVGVGISGDTENFRVLREVLRRAAEQEGVTGTISEFDAIGANGDNTARAAGKAFFATDATELANSLTNIFRQITLGTYSFTSPTVLSVRTEDQNELYLASFSPAAPPATFWPGSLAAYTVNADDTLTYRWNAAAQLQTTDPANRNILTSSYDNSTGTWSRRNFTTSTISPAELGVADAAARDTVVNYVRGASHDNNVKLGDIFHSRPVLVSAPSPFHSDPGYSTGVPSGQGFAQLKEHRRHVVYAGANDGMLHAFAAGDWNSSTGRFSSNDTGDELFAYVPGALLESLPSLVPGEATSHGYFVDSSPRVADVWIDANGDGVKQTSEWHTVLVGGLRRGGQAYYALDITNPDSGVTSGYPKVLWEYSDASVIGETWSEPYIGKVRIQETSTSQPTDRYVAIVGGGESDSGTIGRSLIVFDVGSGSILKRFTGLDNEVVASPTAVLDSAGYIRFVYVTDLGGNLWKFDFRSVGSDYGGTPLSEWTSYKIFQPSPGGQPAYNRVEAALATADGSVRYLYFGTGDRENPISNPNAGKFYAIKDTDSFTGTILESTTGNLADLTASITSVSGGAMGTYGWKVRLGNIASTTNDSATHSGEKVLSDPIVFYDRVYFTTYTPNVSDPCSGGGIARLYGLNYLSAGAGMDPIADSPHNEAGAAVPSHVFADKGMPSSPALSVNPGGQSSVFVGFSDGTYVEIPVASPPKSKTIRSWKEIF